MKTGSLRVRLLLGAAVAIFAALGASWIAMTWLFERHVERRVEADLVRHGKELAARVAGHLSLQNFQKVFTAGSRFHRPDAVALVRANRELLRVDRDHEPRSP